MKTCYFGTNMKMYKTSQETLDFLHDLTRLLRLPPDKALTLFVIPSSISLESAGRFLKDSPILLGAQNMHWEEEGQFSGELSARMLTELDVSMVMLGHSERRHIFGETDEDLNKKVLAAVRSRLIPLLCIGETSDQKSYGCSDEILRMQLKQDLYGFPRDQISRLRIAYEPVWAIGTSGIPADAGYVEKRHAAIKACLAEIFGPEGTEIPVLYGGSVNPQNASGYLSLPGVDGLFVGRSAWKAENFCSMAASLFE